MKIICRKEKTKINLKEYTDEMNRAWKEKNKQYLKELQIFFDRVDNIKDKELRKSVLNQMLICDEILTKIAEEKFNDFYIEGYKKAKMDNSINFDTY